MVCHAASAVLPLQGGRVPKSLRDRMTLLGSVITKPIERLILNASRQVRADTRSRWRGRRGPTEAERYVNRPCKC